MADGADPAAERRALRKAATIAQLAIRYMAEEIEPARKPGTAALYRKYFNNHICPPIGARRARDVTYSDVLKLHRAIGASRPIQSD